MKNRNKRDWIRTLVLIGGVVLFVGVKKMVEGALPSEEQVIQWALWFYLPLFFIGSILLQYMKNWSFPVSSYLTVLLTLMMARLKETLGGNASPLAQKPFPLVIYLAFVLLFATITWLNERRIIEQEDFESDVEKKDIAQSNHLQYAAVMIAAVLMIPIVLS